MLVYESAADGGLESFCRSIRAIYPEMVIVVGLTRMNHNRELQLLEIGVEDVVMESTPENIIVKRIIARLSASRPRQIARI